MKPAYAIIASCLVLFLVSCTAKTGGQSSDEAKPVIEALTCIMVLPARTSVDDGDSLQYKEANRLRQGATFADSVIANELAGNPKVRQIKGSQLNALRSDLPGGGADLMVELGEQLNCEAVLHTTIRRFDQRQGGEMAVDEPASASFEMRLVSVKDKRVLWAADFNETQESLLSNILSFGKAQSRGFKWITVEDLIAQGIKERLTDCPYL